MTPREMDCIELVELLTDYLDGALPTDEAAAIDAHLRICAACRAYLAQFRATIAALGSVDVAALPTQTQESILAAFRDLPGRR